MTEVEWLSSNDPVKMIDWMSSDGVYGGFLGHMTRGEGNRKLRLFCCACYGVISWYHKDLRGVYENDGEGIEDPGGLARIWCTISLGRDTDDLTQEVKANLLREIFGNLHRPLGIDFEEKCYLCKGESTRKNHHGRKRKCDRCSGKGSRKEFGRLTGEKCTECRGFGYFHVNGTDDNEDCLKCNNGWKCKPVEWLKWNDGTVARIARGIYENRTFEDMGILHDVLLDAGCDNQEILDHCRGKKTKVVKRVSKTGNKCPKCNGLGHWRSGVHFEHEKLCPKCNIEWEPGKEAIWVEEVDIPHVRGCYVLDAILGEGRIVRTSPSDLSL